MRFECPYGWKSVAKVGSNFTWESSTVNICDGICDSCDLCGIETCEFHDTSPEATKRFLRANAREHTLEHLLAPIN
ncbi:MAG: hypothetical protein ACRD8U_22055 [Pyrinomonadaceae bacterium]